MKHLVLSWAGLALPLVLTACSAPGSSADEWPAAESSSAATAAAQAGFRRLAALEGDWVGEGPADGPGPMTVSYRLTGGGSALVETLFAGTADEMITIYTVEGGDLMLTHYCSFGNQPRMRAAPMQGDVLDFRFAGGANLDPQRDDHMHDARYEFVSDDELLIEWTGWSGGRADTEHQARVRLTRKT